MRNNKSSLPGLTCELAITFYLLGSETALMRPPVCLRRPPSISEASGIFPVGVAICTCAVESYTMRIPVRIPAFALSSEYCIYSPGIRGIEEPVRFTE